MLENNDKNLKEQIARTLKLMGYTGFEKNKVVFGLMDNASKRIDIAILDRLADKEKTELLKISKAKNKSKILKYLSSKISDLPQIIEQAVSQTVGEFKRATDRD